MKLGRRHLIQTTTMGAVAASAGSLGGVRAAFAAAPRTDVVIGVESDALTLLPNTVGDSVTWSYTHNVVYEPLVTRGNSGEYVPVLATEWKTVNDTTWEFTLRKGVKFQNGAEFNAASVKFSIDYIFDPKNKSIFPARIPLVTGAEVVDAYTARIHTSRPFPELLDNLVNIMMLDPAYITAKGTDFATSNPNGTGVYKLDHWDKGQRVELSARADYWGAQAAIRKVTFKAIPEFSARLSAFLAGEIDLFNNIPVDSIARVKADTNAKVLAQPTARYIYLMLNTFYKGPLQDQRVRQAINHAVDRQEIVSAVLNGYGVALPGIFPSQLSVYAQTPEYAYEPDKAVELFKQAGIDPKQLRLHLDTPNGRYPMDSYVSQAIAAQLARIGIKVEVQTHEWGEFLSLVKTKQARDMFLIGWGPNFEPQALVVGLFSKDATYSGYYDPETEALIQKAVSIFDPQQRRAAYALLQTRFADQAVAVPLWVQTDVYAVAKSLSFVPRLDQTFVPQLMSWQQ